jgi:hypothetical protein
MRSYLRLRQSRSMKTLSIQRPLPSMLIRMPFDSSSPIQSSPVNWLPWSVLKMPGLRPVDLMALRNAFTQKPLSMVLLTSQASTARVFQSMMATR